MVNQKELEFMRYASPNEQRTISREDANYYHAVIVSAVYDLRDGFDATSTASFYPAVQQCIEEHAFLCVIAGDRHTDKGFYLRVPEIDLAKHIIVDNSSDDDSDLIRIEKVLASYLDKPFPKELPGWRVVVRPLKRGCFITFAYSHIYADGPSGVAFHRTLLRAFRTTTRSKAASAVVKTPARKLPEPFDTPETLPISWSFLLTPLLASKLPPFFANLLGLRLSGSTIDAGTWLATPMFFDGKSVNTQVYMQEIEPNLLQKALRAGRERNTKLTGVLLEAIARAFSKAIDDPKITNFVSQTAVNMRKAVDRPRNEMGEFASATYVMHRRDTSPRFNELSWVGALAVTDKLKATAADLHDHAIGLLRYVPSISKWMVSKLGEQRDSSFEMSNIGALVDDEETGATVPGKDKAAITELVFAQPGHVNGPAVCFNFASMQGGSLMYSVTWQRDALGQVGDEREFVAGICKSIRQDIETLE